MANNQESACDIEINTKCNALSIIENGNAINNSKNIKDLNDYCLIHVFQFLPIADKQRIKRVCKRWEKLVDNTWYNFTKLDTKQSTWGLPATENNSSPVETIMLEKILPLCGFYITYVDFSTLTQNLKKHTLDVLAEYCPNLKILNISALKAYAPGLKKLKQNCKKITDLCLGPLDKCEDVLADFFSSSNCLRYIKFVSSPITGSCLMSLPKQTLEMVLFYECRRVSLHDFVNEIQKYEVLHTLSIEKCSLEEMNLYSKNLTYLRISDYEPALWSASMPSVIDLENLNTLNLCCNVSVKDDFLCAVRAQCVNITSIDISCCYYVGNKGLLAVTSLPALQHLNINFLSRVTDEALNDMPNIRTMQCRGCVNLGNAGLSRLVEQAENLEFLDLSGCLRINNRFVSAAIEATRFRYTNTVLRLFLNDTNFVEDGINSRLYHPFVQVLWTGGAQQNLVHVFNAE